MGDRNTELADVSQFNQHSVELPVALIKHCQTQPRAASRPDQLAGNPCTTSRALCASTSTKSRMSYCTWQSPRLARKSSSPSANAIGEVAKPSGIATSCPWNFSNSSTRCLCHPHSCCCARPRAHGALSVHHVRCLMQKRA